MATFVKIEEFIEDLAEKVHDLGADTLKVFLSNAVPAGTKRLKGDWTEITAQNGYTAGGAQATQTSSAQSAGTYKLVVGDVVWTASGGSIGPFRYAVLYNDTPATPLDPCIGYHDYGSSISLNDGESFTWDADPTNGILTVA